MATYITQILCFRGHWLTKILSLKEYLNLSATLWVALQERQQAGSRGNKVTG